MPDPRIRTKGRERALQFLFALDFTNYAWQDTAEDFWELNPTRPAAQQYAQHLVEAIEAKRDDLDREIAAAVHNWTPERVGRIERAILRIALYEMRYADDVPVNVAINEAIELAKRFGADESPRFVNGVLDRLKMLSSGSGGRARKP